MPSFRRILEAQREKHETSSEPSLLLAMYQPNLLICQCMPVSQLGEFSVEYVLSLPDEEETGIFSEGGGEEMAGGERVGEGTNTFSDKGPKLITIS